MNGEIAKIQELIDGKIEGEIIDQTLTRLSLPGENYLSVVMRVDLKVKKPDGNVDTVHAVAKLLPPNTGSQFDGLGTFSFGNEIIWYSEVIPALEQFQKERCTEAPVDCFVRMFGGRLSLDPESKVADATAVVLLENLKVQGYRNADRFVGFNLKIAKEVLRNVAAFHGLQIAMKLTSPETYKAKITSRLQIPKFPENGDNHGPDTCIEKLVRSIPELDAIWSRIGNAVKHRVPSELPVREPWGLHAHYDLWVNNIMVKEEENGGESIKPKIKIIDLQLTPYKTAVCDVIFFLFTSIELETLKEHFEELLRFYYEQFVGKLRDAKTDDSAFTYDGFLKEIGECLKEEELGHVLFFTFLMSAPNDIALDVADGYQFETMMMRVFSRQPTEKHVDRVKFILMECVRRNWI